MGEAVAQQEIKEVVKLVGVLETYVVFYDQFVTFIHSFLAGIKTRTQDTVLCLGST